MTTFKAKYAEVSGGCPHSDKCRYSPGTVICAFARYARTNNTRENKKHKWFY